MNNKIIVTKGNEKIDFYFVSNAGKFYLFTQAYSKGVYEFFRSGRAEKEIKKYRGWDKNPRLDKTIEKIPMYTRYLMKEVI